MGIILLWLFFMYDNNVTVFNLSPPNSVTLHQGVKFVLAICFKVSVIHFIMFQRFLSDGIICELGYSNTEFDGNVHINRKHS